MTPEEYENSLTSTSPAPKGTADWYAQQNSESTSTTSHEPRGTEEWSQHTQSVTPSSTPATTNPQSAEPATTETEQTLSDAPAGTTVSLVSTQHSNTNGDGQGYNVSNYAELIEALQQRMEAIKPLSPEEVAKRKRKQRTEGIISGIADAAQAISNLVFTSQYAPNMYNAKEGMSAKAKERFDKAKAERDAEDERYLNYALQIGKARDAVDVVKDRRQQQNITLQLKVNEDRRRQAKAEHDADVADIDLQIKLGRLSYEEGRAKKMDAERRLAEAYAEHADEKVMSEINAKNRSGRSSGSRSSGRPPEHIVRFPDGHTERFHSETAARNNAATRGGTYITTPVATNNSVTRTDRRGRTSTSTTSSTRDVSTPRVEVDWE